MKKFPTNKPIPVSEVAKIFTVFTKNFIMKVIFSNATGYKESKTIGENENKEFNLNTLYSEIFFVEFVPDDANITGVDVSIS